MQKLLTQSLLIATLTAVTCFAANDNTLGTWKLNMSKSKYTPGPMPVKSLTITREGSDGGVKQRATGERSDGTAIDSSYTAKYDGTEAQVSGNGPYDSIAVRQLNANTLT